MRSGISISVSAADRRVWRPSSPIATRRRSMSGARGLFFSPPTASARTPSWRRRASRRPPSGAGRSGSCKPGSAGACRTRRARPARRRSRRRASARWCAARSRRRRTRRRTGRRGRRPRPAAWRLDDPDNLEGAWPRAASLASFKLSTDPAFAEKLHDIVGLYVDPPAHAVVLSVDEKSQIQALDRTQPGLPMKKGRMGTMTHDYKRHGTTTLFAALNVLDGTVIGKNMARHRHQEFIRFLNALERDIPRTRPRPAAWPSRRSRPSGRRMASRRIAGGASSSPPTRPSPRSSTTSSGSTSTRRCMPWC